MKKKAMDRPNRVPPLEPATPILRALLANVIVANDTTPDRKVVALVPNRIRLAEEDLVFVLSQTTNIDGKRSAHRFTLIRAPASPQDDERYLAPYERDGWTIFPALRKDVGQKIVPRCPWNSDPYRVLRQAILQRNPTERYLVSTGKLEELFQYECDPFVLPPRPPALPQGDAFFRSKTKLYLV